jgi:hypothetical protein
MENDIGYHFFEAIWIFLNKKETIWKNKKSFNSYVEL